MTDDKKRQVCKKIIKQRRHMTKWGIERDQAEALIAQFEGFLVQPVIPSQFEKLLSHVNEIRRSYDRERARKRRVRVISLNPCVMEDPRSSQGGGQVPSRDDVDELLTRSLERYAIGERQKELHRVFLYTGHSSSYPVAKQFGVSRKRVNEVIKAARFRAMAGAFLTVAESRSDADADVLCSTQFALRSPFTAGVLSAYDVIANGLRKKTGDMAKQRYRRARCAQLDEGLPWLWKKAQARLFHKLKYPDDAGSDVCQVQPAFMAMFIAARWGGKDYWPLCRDTLAEARRRGLVGHPVLARHLATIAAYCDEPGLQLAFLQSDQCHVVEKTTTWLFLHGGLKSKLPYGDIVRGRLDTTRKRLRDKKSYSPKPALDYTLRCLNNTRYRNDGLTGMVLTWADMLLADFDDAAPKSVRTQLTKLANTLEHRRGAICETRGLTATYTGVVDRLHWLRRDLAKKFLDEG